MDEAGFSDFEEIGTLTLIISYTTRYTYLYDEMNNIAPGGGAGGVGGTGGAGGGGRDYVDKALDGAERKYGKGKIDPNKARGVNEKITDFARNTFEKVTGKKVPKKVSN